MEEYTVILYDKADGSCPIQEFFNGLDPKMQAKIYHEIKLLAANGPNLRMPHSKTLGNGILELRAKVGSNISRTLYFFYHGKNIVLTNGFIKKEQKTPKREIELAEKYRADYLHRIAGGS